MKTGIFGSNNQPEKAGEIRAIFSQLKLHGASVHIDRNFYGYLTEKLNFTPEVEGFIDDSSTLPDLIISIGGDGTFLRTTAWVGRREIPILGINTGRLGFLADVRVAETAVALDDVFNGRYTVEERSLLKITSPNSGCTDNFALNEVAVLKRDTSEMITIHAWLNDEYLTSYLGDGLIVATPTGSTAYSMSVNGPIIVPDARNFALSPVAPHSLTVRPLLIPDDYKIRLRVEARSRNFLVSADGRSEIFPAGSEFFIQKADFTMRLVKLRDRNFYSTLRGKLLWGNDRRAGTI
jgi:NAD+ kinase